MVTIASNRFMAPAIYWLNWHRLLKVIQKKNSARKRKRKTDLWLHRPKRLRTTD